MSGLKQATRWRAMRARLRRRMSSSDLPENMGPVMTSMRPGVGGCSWAGWAAGWVPFAGWVVLAGWEWSMIRAPLRVCRVGPGSKGYRTRYGGVDFGEMCCGRTYIMMEVFRMSAGPCGPRDL